MKLPRAFGVSVKIWARRFWILIIGIFVAVYLSRQWPLVAAAVASLSWETVILAIVLVAIAKLLLTLVMQNCCRRFGVVLSFAESFHIYNFTQIAKYIPGSIWQFVARVAVLKARGAENTGIRNAMIYEVIWVAGTSGIVGLLLVAAQYRLNWNQLIDLGWGELQLPAARSILALCVLVLAGLSLAAWVQREKLEKGIGAMLPTPSLIALLVANWVVLGLSLWVTSPPFSAEGLHLFYTIGVYCLGYAIGFIVPFAPAGIGVREGVFILGMTPYLPLEGAVLLAAINRMIYVAVEIAYFSIALMQSTNSGTKPIS